MIQINQKTKFFGLLVLISFMFIYGVAVAIKIYETDGVIGYYITLIMAFFLSAILFYISGYQITNQNINNQELQKKE